MACASTVQRHIFYPLKSNVSIHTPQRLSVSSPLTGMRTLYARVNGGGCREKCGKRGGIL